MFKKSLALLLGTCMICSLAGCGGSASGGDSAKNGAGEKTEKSGGKKVVSFYS